MSNIETHVGGFFDYGWPLAEQVTLVDIAHALSKTCRFGGHCSKFYSVAEHAVNVRRLVIEHGRPDLGLAALHHDSHEAYVGDVPTPLKEALGEPLVRLVNNIDCVIAEWVGIYRDRFHHDVIKGADRLALRHEAAVLKPSKGAGDHWGYEFPAPRSNFVVGYEPDEAAHWFMQAHLDETESR